MSFYDQKRQSSIWLTEREKETLRQWAARRETSCSRLIAALLRRQDERHDLDPLLEN